MVKEGFAHLPQNQKAAKTQRITKKNFFILFRGFVAKKQRICLANMSVYLPFGIKSLFKTNHHY